MPAEDTALIDNEKGNDVKETYGGAVGDAGDVTKHVNVVAEKKKSFAMEYLKLRNRFERALIEHKLAAQYFGFRFFYLVFLPMTLIATATTIIGFLISGSASTALTVVDGSGDDRGMADGVAQGNTQVTFEPLFSGDAKTKWAVVVGILGAISTLLTTIGKYTNYQSQHDMHQAAVKALDKICLAVDFERDWFDRKATSSDFISMVVKRRMERGGVPTDHDEMDSMMGADLKSHQAGFKAMQDACGDSPVPMRVLQAFTVLDQRGLVVEDRIFYYNKLWKEFTTYWGWPLFSPNFNVIQKFREWNEELKTMRPSKGRERVRKRAGNYGTDGHQGEGGDLSHGEDNDEQNNDKCCSIL